jgi:hypothetical protein
MIRPSAEVSPKPMTAAEFVYLRFSSQTLAPIGVTLAARAISDKKAQKIAL